MSFFAKQEELLKSVIEICDTTAESYRNTTLENNIRYFLWNMLERIRSRSAALIPLLNGYANDRDVSFGIGLIIRNQATDMIHIMYTKELFFRQDHDTLKKFISNLLMSGFNFSDDFFDLFHEHFESELTREEVKLVKENYRSRMGIPEEDLTSPFPTGVKSIFRKLMENKGEVETDEDLSRKSLALRAFDRFSLYSKLEHFNRESVLLERFTTLTEITTYKKQVDFSVFLNELVHRLLVVEYDGDDFFVQRHSVAEARLKEITVIEP
jgi:hypothetical protein